jgi:ubiquinone/menaquinone biosynthesis C-methylase UbiE
MARLNRDMELAAVAELAPQPEDAVLAVGFGPGVGLAELVQRLPRGEVAGIDPSATMVSQATRRNRAAVAAGRVVLACAAAESIPWPGGRFDGVLAVNSIQLWDPLSSGLTEVARVLRQGGGLVAVTHCWAIAKVAPLEEWIASTSSSLDEVGFGSVAWRTEPFRSGKGLILQAALLRSCNRAAPEHRGPAV